MNLNIRFWAVGILAFMGASAFAGDLTPPPWTPGAPGTTHQRWGFDNPNAFLPDPNFHNPYATPNNPVTMIPGLPGIEWLPSWGLPGAPGRDGVWCLNPGARLIFCIPNADMPSQRKILWSQIKWFSDPGLPAVTLEPFGPPTGTSMTIGTIPLPEPGWMHSTFKHTLDTCPPLEYYHVINGTNNPIYIDQVVIDTACVPEPTTMAALGLGLLALRFRKRK